MLRSVRGYAWLGLMALFGLGLMVLGVGGPQAAAKSLRAGLRLTHQRERLPTGAEGWTRSSSRAVRGITIGPIESGLHPGRGYGSPVLGRALDEAQRLGANWVSLTPFARVWDLSATSVAMDFEWPFEQSRAAVERSVAEAHRRGLRVLLVPHLWVESGEWRALIDPGDREAWKRWTTEYKRFILAWARVAEATGVEMLSVGVELRSWATTDHAPRLLDAIQVVRRVYSGLVTYSANWDDVEQTVILGELDVIGVNAFYPLAEKEGASLDELLRGGERVAERAEKLAQTWDKPIVFTEFGYTTRKDPAVRPWEWPDHMKQVVVDELAQADAYRALLAPLLNKPWFAGLFVWRTYADPNDASQEAEWGFSPRGKLAELVLRDAFAAHFAADGDRVLGSALIRPANRFVGVF